MRPILDLAKRNAICGVLAVGGTRRMAALCVGCSERTIRNTAARDPEFRRQLEQTSVDPEITFLKTLHSAGKDHWQAAKWALQHMYPDRYARKARTMSIDEIKDLVSQLLEAIVKAIPDPHTRAKVRRRISRITRRALSRPKRKPRRGK